MAKIIDILPVDKPIAKKKEEPAFYPPRKRKRKFSGKLFVLFFLVLIFFLIFSFLLVSFSSALIKITPKQEFITIDSNEKAERNGGTQALPFEIMQIQYEDSQKIEPTGISSEGTKASGRIVIYNTTSSSQSLVSNTRFETPEGKIYRINEKITVPADNSLEVMVYADQPGEDYNTDLNDFVVPGFKGDPKYEAIYGRSKTVISGGSSKSSHFITENDIKIAKEKLDEKIANTLRSNASKQKTEDFIFFKDSIVISFEESQDNPAPGSGGNEFIFKEKGVAIVFLLPKEYLAERIIKKHKGDLSGSVRLANLEKLDFKLLDHNKENTEISFNLKGKTHFVWKVDLDSLVVDLKQAKSKDYNGVFLKYPEIKEAEIIFNPSWWQKIPENSSRVHFEEILKIE